MTPCSARLTNRPCPIIDVVVDAEVQQAGALDELPREADVLAAGRGIAARMVVEQDHRGGRLENRRLEHLARVHAGSRRQRAFGDRRGRAAGRSARRGARCGNTSRLRSSMRGAKAAYTSGGADAGARLPGCRARRRRVSSKAATNRRGLGRPEARDAARARRPRAPRLRPSDPYVASTSAPRRSRSCRAVPEPSWMRQELRRRRGPRDRSVEPLALVARPRASVSIAIMPMSLREPRAPVNAHEDG